MEAAKVWYMRTVGKEQWPDIATGCPGVPDIARLLGILRPQSGSLRQSSRDRNDRFSRKRVREKPATPLQRSTAPPRVGCHRATAKPHPSQSQKPKPSKPQTKAPLESECPGQRDGNAKPVLHKTSPRAPLERECPTRVVFRKPAM